MGLSYDQQQKVTLHLRSRATSGCPLCGQRNFAIDDDVQYLGVLDPEFKQPVEGKVYPVISVTCNNCYHTLHLSAMRLGLL